VADTFGQAKSLTYLDDKAIGGRFWDIGNVIIEFDYEAHENSKMAHLGSGTI